MTNTVRNDWRAARLAMRGLLGLAVLACTEPRARVEATTVTVTDPTGDVFGAAGVPKWDLTSMSISRDTAGITVVLELTTDPISPVSGLASAMIGFIDLDVDQEPQTGLGSVVDEYRPRGTGATGLGADYVVVLGNYAADSTVTVFDLFGDPMGQVRPVFSGRRVSIRIPKGLIGDDDGRLDAAAIVGIAGAASDIIPDNGHMTLGGTFTTTSAPMPGRGSFP